MIRFFQLLLVISFVFYGELSSQEADNNPPDRFNSIMASFDYSSNTGSYGIYNTEVNQPSYTPSVSFFSKYGFDISAMYFITGNSDPTFSKATSELDLMAGYQLSLGKYFSVYPSYAHFFVSNESNSVKSSFTDNFQLDVTFEYKFYLTALTGNYLIGDENTPALAFQNYFLIDKEDFLIKNLYFALQPGIDITWSNRITYENQRLDYILASEENLQRFLKNHPRVRERYFQALQRFPNLDVEKFFSIYLWNDFEAIENFALSSVSFVLPVYIMVNSFSLNLSGMYYKPLNTSEYLDDEGKFYFSIGLAYLFSW